MRLPTKDWMLETASKIIRSTIKTKIGRFMSNDREDIIKTLFKIALSVGGTYLLYSLFLWCYSSRNRSTTDSRSEELLGSQELVLRGVPNEFKEQVMNDIKEHGYAVIFKDNYSLYFDKDGKKQEGTASYIGIPRGDKMLVCYRDGKRELMNLTEYYGLSTKLAVQNIGETINGIGRIEKRLPEIKKEQKELQRDVSNLGTQNVRLQGDINNFKQQREKDINDLKKQNEKILELLANKLNVEEKKGSWVERSRSSSTENLIERKGI